MEWQTIRSWRDPGFWLPVASTVCLVFGFGVAAQFWTHSYLQKLQSLGVSDPAAGAAAAERGLRLVGQAVFGFTLVTGAVFFRYFQLGVRQQQLPPSGWWSLGARRVAVGSGARWLARLGLVVSLLLPAAGLGCLLAIRYLLAAFGLSA